MNLSHLKALQSQSATRLVGWMILVLGFISTSVITYHFSAANRHEDQLRFDYEIRILQRRITNQMNICEGALLQTRAFIDNAVNLEYQGIRNFLRDTKIFQRSPGIQGIGYSVVLTPVQIPSHVKLMRKRLPDFKVWPTGPRELYSSIMLLEPINRRNLQALGFDMFSEPIRRKAMEEARDKNAAILTSKVVLVQEDREAHSPGFLLYLPYYRKDVDITTVEGRRQGILGYVYSPFRAPEFFKEIFRTFQMVLAVEIYDGAQALPQRLLYASDTSMKTTTSWQERSMMINGREFLLRFSPLPAFPRATSALKTAMVYLAGTLATLFLWGFFSLLLRQMELARIMAQQNQNLLTKEKEHVAVRDEFLSIASHELKTPLTSLKLQAQVMLRGIGRNDPRVFTPERVKILVKQFDDQTTRLTRLVDDMLDISRIRTGRLQIMKETVELSEVIQDVVERLRPQFISNNGELPKLELCPGIRGNWDRFRIEQVLTNLFTNAMRYGGGRPVKVLTQNKDGWARIDVIDQGIGIAPENLEKIFQRFERAGVLASEISGMGLGLFITNQIVRAHGGSIQVISTPGAGSTFIVTLPI